MRAAKALARLRELSPRLWCRQCKSTQTLTCLPIFFYYTCPVGTKPVFGVSDIARLKQVSSAKETSWKIENLFVASFDMILSNKRIKKALFRLCRCVGLSALLLLANTENRFFSHVVAHIILKLHLIHVTTTSIFLIYFLKVFTHLI